jgi:hypothetical protein
MNFDVNTETKSKIAWISGLFCAVGGFCIGSSAGGGASLVGAIIGFVVGYASAFISPLLAFGLICVSAVAFWHSNTVRHPVQTPEDPKTRREVKERLISIFEEPTATPFKSR